MVKVILNKLLAYFNLKLINKKFVGTIDKRDLIPFSEDNDDYRLYFEGLIKSNNTNTDNFFKQSRHLDLINLTKKVLEKEKVYDFVECGCWRGHSSFFISKLINQSERKINFHIFDSFEGLSKHTNKDDELSALNDSEKNKIRKQFISNEDFVKKYSFERLWFC